MSTGACGINCDVCQLHVNGACSTCGPGTSLEAEGKLEAQHRILGGPCPILACARLNRIAFCLRDCASFPCEHFSAGPYPFSRGFLAMQERRRGASQPAYAPDGSHVTVAAEYWERLQTSDLLQVCARTQFTPSGEKGLVFRFLNQDVMVDVPQRCLKKIKGSSWERAEDPLLELATVLYLINVKDVFPLGRDIVGPKDLREGHFFQGPHELKIAPLVERYGKDIDAFRLAAESLEGEPMAMADAAFRLKPFPRVHLYYLFWKGDDEFAPRMSVLFDRSIEKALAADAIWGLVNRVSMALLEG
jgi:Domain of unknown function (DUF3786)